MLVNRDTWIAIYARILIFMCVIVCPLHFRKASTYETDLTGLALIWHNIHLSGHLKNNEHNSQIAFPASIQPRVTIGLLKRRFDEGQLQPAFY